MLIGSLAEALEHEHREIDAGIEAYTSGPTPDSRAQLLRATAALRRHIYLEEEILFPPLYAAGMVAPLLVMLREHGQIWDTLDSLERALDADPQAAPRLIRQLTAQLQHHNLKEERIVYPQADTALPDPVATRLRAFLDSGQLPTGWVCLKARR